MQPRAQAVSDEFVFHGEIVSRMVLEPINPQVEEWGHSGAKPQPVGSSHARIAQHERSLDEQCRPMLPREYFAVLFVGKRFSITPAALLLYNHLTKQQLYLLLL